MMKLTTVDAVRALLKEQERANRAILVELAETNRLLRRLVGEPDNTRPRRF